MPVAVYSTESGGVISICSGTLSGQELINSNRQLYDDKEQIKQIRYQICDFTDVKGFDTCNEDIRELAVQDQYALSINASMMIAIICSDDLIYSLSRMWQSYIGDPSIKSKVFGSLDEACDWINDGCCLNLDPISLKEKPAVA